MVRVTISLGSGGPLFFPGEGVAIHSTFWHNDFGVAKSHGCVNAAPEDAKWIWRWTVPDVTYNPGDKTVQMPGGTIIKVIGSWLMNVSLGLAFLAGLASFLSPCVFSLVPVYVSDLAVGPLRPQTGIQLGPGGGIPLATALRSLLGLASFLLSWE